MRASMLRQCTRKSAQPSQPSLPSQSSQPSQALQPLQPLATQAYDDEYTRNRTRVIEVWKLVHEVHKKELESDRFDDN